MHQPITDFFIFTKRERLGIVVLISLILLLILVRTVILNLTTSEYDYSQIENELALLKQNSDSIEQVKAQKSKFLSAAMPKPKSKIQKTIDPNNASLNDWKQLGFSSKQAKVILNYKAKGATFRKKEDLLKLFVINQKKLNEIAPYIEIDNHPKKKENDRAKSKPKAKHKERKPEPEPVTLESININTADTTALISIKYIGPYYAISIVKYRNLLGGFYSKQQFKEIYGLQDHVQSLEALEKHVWIDPENVQKININSCDSKQLAKHYYIKWSVANALVKYRKMHGKFQTLKEITKCDLVTDDLYSKIAPYLKLNDD